jgi:dTDP-4-dehydrorhamnose reductase
MERLLITGAGGFLGWNLCREAVKSWEVWGVYRSNPPATPGAVPVQADLTRYKDIHRLFEDVSPRAVIHSAAVSDANFCQKHPSEAYIINTEASVNIAGLCADRAIPCIFTSSDLVFDGNDPPYAEDDKPSPVNVYGEQKLKAEEGMKARYPEAVICRLPLMFGDPGPASSSFIQPVISAMRNGSEVRLFTDEFRTPVSGRDAAKGLLMALRELPSILHLGGPERISRYEFGRLIARIFKIEDAKLYPCRRADLRLSAPRPQDVSLDSGRACAMGFRPNPLRIELKRLAAAL